MKFSFHLLKKFLKFSKEAEPSLDVCAKNLTQQGHEVESIFSFSHYLKDVKIGLIQKTKAHPENHHLTICEVQSDQTYQIVCGAQNVQKGLFVPIIPPQKSLGERTFASRQIKGITSEGMILAREEMGLFSGPFDPEKGIWNLSDPLQGGKALKASEKGQPFLKIFETFDDAILDVAVMPNRLDLFSHEGLARELLVGLKTENHSVSWNHWTFSDPSLSLQEKPLVQNHLNWPGIFLLTSIDSSHFNQDFYAFCRNNLEKLGQGSISPVVDCGHLATQLFGQPSHAYDWDKVGSQLQLKQGASTSFTALNDKIYHLNEKDCYLEDEKKEVHSLLGIMGGQKSKWESKSKKLLLELLAVDSTSVRKSSRFHGILSEAGLRFERGVLPELLERQLQEHLGILKEMDLIKGDLLVDKQNLPSESSPIIEFDPTLIPKITACQISKDQFEPILKSLGLKNIGANSWKIPIWRLPDLKSPEDLVEEVIRVWGVDEIPSVPFLAPHRPLIKDTSLFPLKHHIRQISRRLGYTESPHAGFLKENWFQNLEGNWEKPYLLANPLAQEEAGLPNTLVPLLWEQAQKALNRKEKQFHGFALEKTFHKPNDRISHFVTKDPQDPYEKERLDEQLTFSGVCTGLRQELLWNQKEEPWSFFHILKDMELICSSLGWRPQIQKKIHPGWSALFHPTSQAFFTSEGMEGWVGVLKPSVIRTLKIKTASPLILWEMKINPDFYDPFPTPQSPQATGLLNLLEKDLSLIIPPAVLWKHIEESIQSSFEREKNSLHLEDLRVFDVHEQEGQTFYGIRLRFRPYHNLTDEFLQKLLKRVTEDLEKLNVYLKAGAFL